MDAITDKVMNRLDEVADLDDIVIDGQTLYDHQDCIDLPIIGRQCCRVSVKLRETHISIDASRLTASFAGSGTANQGTINARLDAPGASVSTSLKVKVDFDSDLIDGLADAMDFFGFHNEANAFRNVFTMNEFITISASQITSPNTSFTISRPNNGLPQANLNALALQVGSVNFNDSGPIDEVADFFGQTLCHYFPGFSGPCSLNSLLKKVINAQLASAGNNQEIRAIASSAATAALRGVSIPSGGLTLPLGDEIGLNIGASLGSFNTKPNRLMASINMSVARTSGNAFGTFAYSYLARTAQNLETAPISGDAQVFLPLSAFDKTMFELMKSGLVADQFNTPQFAVSVPGQALPVTVPGMTLRLNNPAVPRATAVSGNQIELSFSATLTAVTGNGVTLASVSPTIKVRVKVLTDGESLYWKLVSVSIPTMAGQLSIPNAPPLPGARTINASFLRPYVEAQVRALVQDRADEVTLMPRTINLPGDFSITIGSMSVGSQYIMVPITLH